MRLLTTGNIKNQNTKIIKKKGTIIILRLSKVLEKNFLKRRK